MKAALIIGRAKCVWDDLDGANYLLQKHKPKIIAVNVIGSDYGGFIDHWVSFHPELLPTWIMVRKNKGYPDGYQLWTSSRGRHTTAWERSLGLNMIDCEGGSSGMIALKVALHINASHIVLAGIPMVNSYGQYDTSKEWDEADMHKKLWEKLTPDVKARIRSMSGWTRQHFGYPTELWLSPSST